MLVDNLRQEGRWMRTGPGVLNRVPRNRKFPFPECQANFGTDFTLPNGMPAKTSPFSGTWLQKSWLVIILLALVFLSRLTRSGPC